MRYNHALYDLKDLHMNITIRKSLVGVRFVNIRIQNKLRRLTYSLIPRNLEERIGSHVFSI